MKNLFFLLFSVFVSSAQASFQELVGSTVSTQILNCFESAYNDPKIYQTLRCSMNVRRLYNTCFKPHEASFAQRGLDPAHVLYVLRVNGKNDFANNKARTEILPRQARGRVFSWKFHVILEFNGYIFDLDYTDEPAITTTGSYFKSMFRLRGPWQYVVREIDAAHYAEDYIAGRWEYYIQDPEGLYPLISVGNYVQN